MTHTNHNFIPRDRAFWLCHCSLLMAISIANGLAILAWGEKWLFDIATHILWLPLYTVGVLSFRTRYRRRNWQRLNTGALIVIGLSYAMAVAVGATLVSLACTLPISWNYLFSADFLEKFHTTVNHQLARLLAYGILSSYMFAAVWIFTYLSVTTSRRARQAELDKLKLENGLKQAQITSLSNQLNPHFLFNSLNNIRFMIYENPAHADSTITALSDILRYSLGSGSKAKVTLEEELTIVKRYVDVASLQFEDRLDFQLAVPTALNSLLIPPMSVQLLVENAIKHGIDDVKERATLSLRAELLGAVLQITVRNPISQKQSRQPPGTGTGLKNIEQRLALLYGGNADLSVEKDDQIFCVKLTVPREEHL